MGKYRRSEILYRPKINWKKVIVIGMSSICVCGILSVIVNYILCTLEVEDEAYKVLYFIIFVFWVPVDSLITRLFFLFILLEGIIFIKKIMIFCVRVYQCYAPDSIRLACRFNPSCSQYMILAIEKYGALRGVIKGLNRLSRCHAPNEGDDYP